MRFVKYQALGNEYLVVEGYTWGTALTPDAVRTLCDCHFGVGADGILVREAPPDTEPFRLRILKPDGSEAEKKGNKGRGNKGE
jgi:diaminopimelate epimerase